MSKRYINYNHNYFNVKEYTEEEARAALYFLTPLDHTYNQWHSNEDEPTFEEITTHHDWIECIFENDVQENKENFEMYDREIARNGYYVDDGFVITRNE